MSRPRADSVDSQLRPNLDTLRVFEQDGHRYRIYVTVGGAICVDRQNTKTETWDHVPLMKASEKDLTDVLRARYSTEDEEIARAVSSYGA